MRGKAPLLIALALFVSLHATGADRFKRIAVLDFENTTREKALDWIGVGMRWFSALRERSRGSARPKSEKVVAVTFNKILFAAVAAQSNGPGMPVALSLRIQRDWNSFVGRVSRDEAPED